MTISHHSRTSLSPLNTPHTTPRRGMQGHFIPIQTMIMRLHDINLPIIRPIRSIRQPQRGPGATAEGGVDDVEDEEARVVGVSGLDAD